MGELIKAGAMGVSKVEFLRGCCSILLKERAPKPKVFQYKDKLMEEIMDQSKRPHEKKAAGVEYFVTGLFLSLALLFFSEKCLLDSMPY